jgi:glycosyltransferase involved in cell wall biosynthesis
MSLNSGVETGERLGMNQFDRSKARRIGIVSPIMSRANIEPFRRLVVLLAESARSSVVIQIDSQPNLPKVLADKTSKAVNIVHTSRRSPVTRALGYLYTQLRIALIILKFSSDVDTWVFYLGDYVILPILASRISRKDAIVTVGGSIVYEVRLKGTAIDKIMIPARDWSLSLCKKIVVYSRRMMNDRELHKYESKIVLAQEHYVDFESFRVIIPYTERENLIGYVGRFEHEKGVLSLIGAIPEILARKPEFQFVIGGDGSLSQDMINLVDKFEEKNKVKFVGWIPYGSLPKHLNQLRVLILPSFSEGLPNILIEAMACGTPVLSTSVGAVPDLIRHLETGFLIESNDSHTIAQETIRFLEDPNLVEIAENGRRHIQETYSFSSALQKWRVALTEKGGTQNSNV